MAEAKSEGQEVSRLAKRAGVVAVFTLLSRILGFFRDAVMTSVFGASVAYDAFIAAQLIPNMMRRLVAEGTLVITFVPLLAQEKEQGGLAAMRRFMAATFGLLLPVLLLIVGFVVVFPQVAVGIIAGGFDPERASQAAVLTRVMMPFLFCVSLVAVAGGALNTQGIFAPPAAAPVLLNISIVSIVLLFRHWFAQPIMAAAWGVLLGGVAQLILQIPFLLREKLLVFPSLNWSHPSLRLLLWRMGPALFGVAVYQLNLVAIGQIASYLPQGQMSCHYVATRLQEFALGIFAVSISVAALPTLSEHAARKDVPALWRTFHRAFGATTFITVPAMVGLFVLAEAIVATLFGHGKFDLASVKMSSGLVQIMALALIPIGSVRVIVPTYYAVGDTRTPVIAATLSMVTTVCAGIYLMNDFQIYGLSTASVMAVFAQVAVLSLFLNKVVRAKVGDSAVDLTDRTANLFVHPIRCFIATLPGAVAIFVCNEQIDWYVLSLPISICYLGILSVIFVCFYGLFARILRISEVELIAGAVMRKLGRRARR